MSRSSNDERMIRAYLGLGSNLGDRRRTLGHAVSLLEARPEIQLRRVSPLYETEPVDAAGGWFFNGVVEAETSASPRELLDIICQVEGACGRPRPRQRGEARVVDIDLLLYGSQIVEEPDLHVPHPRMHIRRFVLVPLAELDSGLWHPGLGMSIGDLLGRLPPLPEVRLVARDWVRGGASEGRLL